MDKEETLNAPELAAISVDRDEAREGSDIPAVVIMVGAFWVLDVAFTASEAAEVL
jgi:hypothetical protein